MTDRLPVRDELYLLAHDDSGKPLIHVPSLGVGLAAGLLIDLALRGQIDAASGQVLTGPRPAGRNAGQVNEGLEGQSLAMLTEARGHPPTVGDVLMVWQAGLYERVRAEMVAAGVLRAVKVRRLGLLPATRYQADDESLVVRARSSVRRTVTGQVAPNAADAALCGLLAELRLERTLHLSTDNGTLRQSLVAIADRHHETVRRILVGIPDVVRNLATSAV